eukprot:TRINITY_DN21442_c0_g1_i1.p1 TRINITY_DN21442_c0_g1~~TRINITY_DN21442_c0_g1_i1.p1  ORF type:complete len:348 (-),score=56.91 TRINITY_DN21442_c0_g1_i1:85-1128(-)
MLHRRAGTARAKKGQIELRRKLAPRFSLTDNTSEVFAVQMSPDGAFVAAGFGDGSIRVHHTDSGRLAYTLHAAPSVGTNVAAMPVTSLRFRPTASTSKTKNMLLSGNASGQLQHWHVTSGKCLHTTFEEGNQVYAIDYTADGATFMSAGKDKMVRVYDETTKELLRTLTAGPTTPPGHSNRIFAVKASPDDPNVILSGGWDNTVQIWDLRRESPARSIYGPHICGDALDLHGNIILTGSWCPDNQLQLWDYTTCQLIESIPWQTGPMVDKCLLYAAQFSKEGQAELIVAGGSGANEAKVFDRATGQCIGTVDGLPRAVYSADFSHDGKVVAIGGGDGSLRVFDVTSI